MNFARAAGPALAGLIIAGVGTAGLFWALAAGLSAVTLLLTLRRPPTRPPDRPERIGAAMRAGVRYTRFAPPLRRVLLRGGLFVVFASGLWALLPLVAVDRLDLDASGFGILLAFVGTGAVTGALCMPLLGARATLDRIVAAGSATLGVALGLLTVISSTLAAAPFLVLAGFGWICGITGVGTVIATVTPNWIRGRAVAAFFLVFNGGLAIGSPTWGLVANQSLRTALLIPAGGLAAGALLRPLIPLPDMDPALAEPSSHWRDPIQEIEVPDHAGPVLVTIDYDVASPDEDAFVAAMRQIAVVRRRDGASRWHLYRDVAVRGRFVETFTVASWVEHLRQHERSTHGDLLLEEQAAQLMRRYVVRHLVSAL